jgi:hypothetical protein
VCWETTFEVALSLPHTREKEAAERVVEGGKAIEQQTNNTSKDLEGN